LGLKGFVVVAFSVLITLSASGQDFSAPDSLNRGGKDSLAAAINEFEWFSAHTIKGIQYSEDFVSQKLRKNDQMLTVFGYYRLFLYGRNMVEAYPNLAPYEKAFSVGDGYREPMLSMSVVGRPNSKTSFGTELFLFTPYLGSYQEGNVFTTNLGINFYGNFRTDHGKFGIRAGGIHWYNLSPFTIGIFQVLDRFSIFDRTPWEGIENTRRYDSYFKSGVAAPGDLRWNNQAFQGLILNGAQLPGDISFDLFWGRTQPTSGLPGGIINPFESIPPTLDAGNVPTYNGFAGTARTLPSIVQGGKIQRSFGPKNQTFAYNMIRNVATLDSLSDLKRIYQVHTLSLDVNIADINVTGELGAGSFKSPTYKEKWGEALMLRFNVPSKYTFIPLDIQLYQISKDFFNQSGEIFTNSNPDILENIGLLPGTVGAGGQVSQVNQLVHNRRGINLNTGFDWGFAKLNVGWGLAREIDPLSTVLNFVHRINGLALSRVYNPFPADATGPTVFGPYNRLTSFFRGVSEVVQTTDIDGANATATNRKYFNSIDIQAKINSTFLERSLYFFYLASFGSVEENASIIPSMHDQSYLFVQYHELDVYYEIIPGFLLTGYLGIENARGGRFTDWGETSQLPRDQLGTGVGVGFDWTLAENCGLYVRYRWMEHEDRSFELDRYRGREITVELKTFF
jgi:hypothetical protein